MVKCLYGKRYILHLVFFIINYICLATFINNICRLSSFLCLVLLPILQAHATVVHLHLVFDLLLLPLLPVTAILVLDGSRSALVSHLLLNLLELSWYGRCKADESSMINFLDRAADDPVAVFVISAYALAQLDKLTLGIAGRLNDKTNARCITKGPVV